MCGMLTCGFHTRSGHQPSSWGPYVASAVSFQNHIVGQKLKRVKLKIRYEVDLVNYGSGLVYAYACTYVTFQKHRNINHLQAYNYTKLYFISVTISNFGFPTIYSCTSQAIKPSLRTVRLTWITFRYSVVATKSLCAAWSVLIIAALPLWTSRCSFSRLQFSPRRLHFLP